MVTDNGHPAERLIKNITIFVSDINERPTSINLDNSSFQENCNKGMIVGNLTVADPDNVVSSSIRSRHQKQNHSCSIRNSSVFVIIDNQLVVHVDTIDYEQVFITLFYFYSFMKITNFLKTIFDVLIHPLK